MHCGNKKAYSLPTTKHNSLDVNRGEGGGTNCADTNALQQWLSNFPSTRTSSRHTAQAMTPNPSSRSSHYHCVAGIGTCTQCTVQSVISLFQISICCKILKIFNISFRTTYITGRQFADPSGPRTTF